ncbi:hypothetical protein [Bacillus kwashiorkori]|uniref:hypothetical protein n=1 Tax=Bacillus kwashiorkori TaxID=1522318 RepID=UPI000780E980|nr:hypothetical protein [Bacillus kwashiorkori]
MKHDPLIEQSINQPQRLGTIPIHGQTAVHGYRGLADMFIIDDEESSKLPSEYGVNNIPLIIQEKLYITGGGAVLFNSE